MKRFNIIFLLISISFISICCKNKSDTSNVEKIEKFSQYEINENCIVEADSLKIKTFVIAVIEDMTNKNYNDIIEKMENPSNEKKVITEISESFPNYLESIFSLDIDNEDGETIGKIKDIQNAKIVYEKDKENCLEVSVGLDSGLYFDIKKIKGKLKITKYDMAG